MHGHADVFGTDRVAVGVQFQPAGDRAQAAVQAHQHLLAVALQHAGQVAHRQPRFQFVFGDQAQAGGLAGGQGGLGRQRRADFQSLPGQPELGAEAAGDLVAAAAQLAHAVQEQQLRGARPFGTVEQDVVVTGHGRREGIPQRRQEGVAGQGQQHGVAGQGCGIGLGRTHARGSRAGGGNNNWVTAGPLSRNRILRPTPAADRDPVGISQYWRNFSAIAFRPPRPTAAAGPPRPAWRCRRRPPRGAGAAGRAGPWPPAAPARPRRTGPRAG